MLLYVEALERLVKTDDLSDNVEADADEAEGVLNSGFERIEGVGVLESGRDAVRRKELL